MCGDHTSRELVLTHLQWKGGPAMFTNQTISYLWHMWVDMFSGLGLPWSSHTTAYVGLIAVFYVIGVAVKALMTPGK
jgi:hypothetical protein